jgi:hypothetical protein
MEVMLGDGEAIALPPSPVRHPRTSQADRR